ncbi:MAG: hypothetical protein ACTSVK_16370 [Promethearchaeota archaeon]
MKQYARESASALNVPISSHLASDKKEGKTPPDSSGTLLRARTVNIHIKRSSGRSHEREKIDPKDYAGDEKAIK